MAKGEQAAEAAAVKVQRPTCGIVRPIAAISDYEASHWSDVGGILEDAADLAGYDARLVSDSASSNIILQEIVTNLFQDDVVICDVSARNPNVMFELGLRMAFQKPVVVVCDYETPFSFDITVVKHIQYPRTLRYADILKFKDNLAVALKSSVEAGNTYLQRFGPITATALEQRSVGVEDVLSELVRLRSSVADLRTGLLAPINWSSGIRIKPNKHRIVTRESPARILTEKHFADAVIEFLELHDVGAILVKPEGEIAVINIIAYPAALDPLLFKTALERIDPEILIETATGML